MGTTIDLPEILVNEVRVRAEHKGQSLDDAAADPKGLAVAVAPPAMTQEEWRQFIVSTAGSIADPTFVRHPQGEYERRESLLGRRRAWISQPPLGRWRMEALSCGRGSAK
jgi:hypothetical protein